MNLRGLEYRKYEALEEGSSHSDPPRYSEYKTSYLTIAKIVEGVCDDRACL